MNAVNHTQLECSVLNNAAMVPQANKSLVASVDVLYVEHLDDGRTRDHTFTCVGAGAIAEAMVAKWTQYTKLFVTGSLTAIGNINTRIKVRSFVVLP